MANLTLSHSGNMGITSAYISDSQIYTTYSPNNSGRISGWSFNESSPSYESGGTYNVVFTPQFQGEVLSESFTVSGVDALGNTKSDTSILRQNYDKDLRNYLAGGFIQLTENTPRNIPMKTFRVDATDPGTSGHYFITFNPEPNYSGSYAPIGYYSICPDENMIFENWGYRQITNGTWVSGNVYDCTFAQEIYFAGGEANAPYSQVKYRSENAVQGSGVVINSSSTTENSITFNFTITGGTGNTFSISVGTVSGSVDAVFERTYSIPPIDATAITLNVDDVIVNSGVATVTIEPAYANNYNIAFSSSNPSIAVIDSNGNITGYQSGTVTICARDLVSGLMDCKTITIQMRITSLSIVAPDTITNTGYISYVYSPAIINPTSSDFQIYYESSDSSIANVDSSGRVVVYQDGVVTFCVGDLISGLKSCKEVVVEINDIPDTGDTGSTNEYLTFEIFSNGYINWHTPTSEASTTIEYKKNNGNWTSITSSPEETHIPVSTGDILMFRGNNPTYFIAHPRYGAIYYQNGFHSSTARFRVRGNIMSLINSTNFSNINWLDYEANYGAFKNMFMNCTGLTYATALVLPALVLSNECYQHMFVGCTSLVAGPRLPATMLANSCYANMFTNCSSLAIAPELPATELTRLCYYSMFEGCSSLVTAPTLPATTLGDYCYEYMFKGCTSLTTAPALPAQFLKFGCYAGMFRSCTSLVNPPALPARSMIDSSTASPCEGVYDAMFLGCTSLTTAPALPATTLGIDCYRYMFAGCTSLINAPALPATSITERCYYAMFQGCTSLTVAPVLPAYDLAYYCYKNMFSGCTSLNYIKCLAINGNPGRDYTTDWVKNVPSGGTFIKNISMGSWATGKSGIPNGWAVYDAT